jgi:hypothetical protein
MRPVIGLAAAIAMGVSAFGASTSAEAWGYRSGYDYGRSYYGGGYRYSERHAYPRYRYEGSYGYGYRRYPRYDSYYYNDYRRPYGRSYYRGW